MIERPVTADHGASSRIIFSVKDSFEPGLLHGLFKQTGTGRATAVHIAGQNDRACVLLQKRADRRELIAVVV